MSGRRTKSKRRALLASAGLLALGVPGSSQAVHDISLVGAAQLADGSVLVMNEASAQQNTAGPAGFAALVRPGPTKQPGPPSMEFLKLDCIASAPDGGVTAAGPTSYAGYLKYESVTDGSSVFVKIDGFSYLKFDGYSAEIPNINPPAGISTKQTSESLCGAGGIASRGSMGAFLKIVGPDLPAPTN